jgi:perosamine synthetase
MWKPTMRYPVAKPDLTGNELKYVTQAVASSWVSSQGEYVDKLETALREFLGADNVMVCTNGTVALHLALMALDIGPGDEVIVPTLTYVASANAVAYTGATPVFADSHPETWCLDPDSVRRLISPRTKAIMPVHLYGHMCEMNALNALAERNGIAIVEDAAESLGAMYHDHPAGTLGDLATFSFFGNKLVTTGEGGLVVARDPEVMKRIWLTAHQGMDPARRYWHPVLGYNYRMTNLAAALGVAQMERIDEFIGQRIRLADWYHARLAHHLDLILPRQAPQTRHAYWMYSLLLHDASRRDAVMRGLAERGVETRPFFYPIHEFPMYRNAPSDRGCPVAVNLSRRGVCLPSYFQLRETDVDAIVNEFLDVLQTTDSFALASQAA